MRAFAKKYADDNSYGYKKWTSNIKTHQCPICHPNSGKGWNCIGYVSAICYHGGGITDVTCSCSGIGNDAFFNKVTLDSWKKKNGNQWKMITNGGKKLAQTQLQAGDVLLCYDGSKFKHIVFYYGDGYIADSNSGKTQISIRKYSSLGVPAKKGFRPLYTKKATTTKALSKGDKNAEVTKLQKFLKWAGFDCGTADGDFGEKTLGAVKSFQYKVGLTADGEFGSKSLAKAKEYTK